MGLFKKKKVDMVKWKTSEYCKVVLNDLLNAPPLKQLSILKKMKKETKEGKA